MTKTLLLLSLVGPVLGISASETWHKKAKTIVPHPQAKLTVLDIDLLKAAKEGNVAEIEKLIEKGADVNAVIPDGDFKGWTALMLAAGRGHSDVYLKLIEKGADVNVNDREGRTALMGAVKKGNLGICELLIKNGVDVNAKNKKGYTALMYAAAWGRG